MNLSEILRMRGFQLFNKTKLVRHTDKSFDVKMLYDSGWLKLYQSVQSKDRFTDCDYVVSFLGIESTNAKFVGIYKIINKTKVKYIDIPKEFPYSNFFNPEDFYYEMKEVDILNDLKDRLIIDWGKSPVAWHQWLDTNDKEILEILPSGGLEKTDA